MDFVDWVEKVMQVTAVAWKGLETSTREFNGISAEEIAKTLNIYTEDEDVMTFLRSKAGEALRDAMRELERLGLIEDGAERFHYKLTQEGRKFPNVSLSAAWGQILRIHLDDEQRDFLVGLAQIGQELYGDYVCIHEVVGDDLAVALGWDNGELNNSRVFYVAQSLESAGMVTVRAAIGRADVCLTYAGLVAVTRKEQSVWIPIVEEAVKEWESTNIDFKRQLNLKSDKEKAEFVRDVLALATTKSSGRRLLIIGFDDKTHQFAESVDSKMNQEQLENILHHFTEPTPSVRYHRVPWAGSIIGIIEIFRESEKIPYKVKNASKGQHVISDGDIFVRHSSRTEIPTPDELQDLSTEGEEARRPK